MQVESEEKKVVRNIKVKLTPQEIMQYGQEAGLISSELGDLNRKFDDVKKQWKGKLIKVESSLTSLLRKLKEGHEHRNVECSEVKDFAARRVRYYHEGNVVEERNLHEHEMQKSFIDPEVLNASQAPDYTPQTDEHDDLRDVMYEETHKHTKHSLLEGPVT